MLECPWILNIYEFPVLIKRSYSESFQINCECKNQYAGQPGHTDNIFFNVVKSCEKCLQIVDILISFKVFEINYI